MNGTPRTKDQLGLGQIGLLRIGERSDTANRCSDVTTVVDFGVKCLFEPYSCSWSPSSVFGTLGGGFHSSVPFTYARILGFGYNGTRRTVRRIVSQCPGFTLAPQPAASPWRMDGAASRSWEAGVGVVACSKNSATRETGAAFTAGSGGAAVSDGGGCGRACPGPNTCPAVAWSVGSLIGLAGAPREGSGGCGGKIRDVGVQSSCLLWMQICVATVSRRQTPA